VSWSERYSHIGHRSYTIPYSHTVLVHLVHVDLRFSKFTNLVSSLEVVVIIKLVSAIDVAANSCCFLSPALILVIFQFQCHILKFLLTANTCPQNLSNTFVAILVI